MTTGKSRSIAFSGNRADGAPMARRLLLGEAGRGSREAFRRAIRGGFAESRILDVHGQRMVDRDYGIAGPSKCS
jgi:hypothetical protein